MRRGPADFAAFVASHLLNPRKTPEAQLHKPLELLAWPCSAFDAALERAVAKTGYVAAFSVEHRLARRAEAPLDAVRLQIPR